MVCQNIGSKTQGDIQSNSQHLNLLSKTKKNKKIFEIQLIRVYKSLLESPKTMKEVHISTGIMRENVCRHVSTLRNMGKVKKIRKRYCKITKFPAWELTTDVSLFPVDNQLNLFD